MASIVKVTTDGYPNGPLSENELGFDNVTGEMYVGSGNGTADGSTLSADVGETLVVSPITYADSESYGLTWDETNDTYTRVGDSDYTRLQSKMKRCVLDSNGQVLYYLHPKDSTKKLDGTDADLTGGDGNVMVEIPLTYLKYTYDATSGVTHTWEISDVEEDGFEPAPCFIQAGEVKEYRYYPAYLGSLVDGKLMSVSGAYPTTNLTREYFRDAARANGEAFHQIDWLLYEFVALMAIIEYGTMNIQSALGQGRTALSGGAWSNGSYIGISGLSNKDGNYSGNYTYSGDADDTDADMSYMSYRGCENLFGNVWRFVDGINIRDRVPYINDNPNTFADDIFEGDYVSAGVTMASSNGYARTLANSNKGFFPASVGGTESTCTTDYYYQNSGDRIAVVGGLADYGLNAGPLNLAGNSAASLVLATVGAGVSA